VGITGTRSNGSVSMISALIAPGLFGSNDNLFYISAFPQLNVGGISYVAGGNSHKFFYQDSKYGEFTTTIGGAPQDLVDVTITSRETPVPVPATLALFGLGLLGLGLTRAKRAL